MALPSSILWQNENKTVVLLDLPRTLEEAQIPLEKLQLQHQNAGETTAAPRQRIVSAQPPPQDPYPTPEPKAAAAGFMQASSSAAAQVAELMTRATVESALQEVACSYHGPWCLPRVFAKPAAVDAETGNHGQTGKREGEDEEMEEAEGGEKDSEQNARNYLIPPGARFIPHAIAPGRDAFLSAGPFDLMVLDPPWPNRSARRKKKQHGHSHDHDHGYGYATAGDLESARALLSLIPVASRLRAGGLIAVWVTNAPRLPDLLAGVFAEWQVETVAEWVWLKVTARGDPVVALDSVWRKPWERLLIARRKKLDNTIIGNSNNNNSSSGTNDNGDGVRDEEIKKKNKVLIAVPDAHSRKPNLRGLFADVMPPSYTAIEIFARSLTAGWWSWGDEVLRFQRRECWVDDAG